MTNAEKFLLTDMNTFIINLTEWEQNKHQETKFDKVNIKELRNFLQAPVQPTLTEDERVILRNIPKCFTNIGRDKNNELYLYTTKNDRCTDLSNILLFNHLFQFIKERRRIRDS